VHMILGFLPRDVPEAFIAGHCVMLHEVMTLTVHDILSEDAEQPQRRPRHNPVALNKAFNDNLDRLEQYRLRPADGSRDTAPEPPRDAAVPAPEATPPAPPAGNAPPPAAAAQTTADRQPEPVACPVNRAARRQAARARMRAEAAASQAARATQRTAPPAMCHPGTPQGTGAATTSEAVLAALRSGNPADVAPALEIKRPGDARLPVADSNRGSESPPPSAILAIPQEA